MWTATNVRPLVDPTQREYVFCNIGETADGKRFGQLRLSREDAAALRDALAELLK